MTQQDGPEPSDGIGAIGVLILALIAVAIAILNGLGIIDRWFGH